MPFDFAADGHELIRMANEREYALIWVDLTMPYVSGCEGVSAIRNGNGPNANSCICAVTGDPVQDINNREGGCHFDWAFQKPVDYTQMQLWFSNAVAVAKNPHHSFTKTEIS
jgi:CheY-like chemotaxis protein